MRFVCLIVVLCLTVFLAFNQNQLIKAQAVVQRTSTPVPSKNPRVFTSTRTRTFTKSPTSTKTGTKTRTGTPTQTETATPTITLTSSKTATRTKSPTRTARPSNTPIVLMNDFNIKEGVTGLFKPYDGDICWGVEVAGLTEVVVEFTQNYSRGIPISGGGCITDGSITAIQLRSSLRTMGKDYEIKTLPIWVPTKSPTLTETFTPTLTNSKTPTNTPTNTPTQTRTPTLSPTVTVISELPIDWETSSGIFQPFPGTICAGEQVGEFYYEVVEFMDEYAEMNLINGWCYIGGEFTAEDILNFLQRQGLPYTGIRTLP